MFQSTIVKKYISSQSKENLLSKWDLFREFFHDKGNQNRIRELKEEQFQEGFLKELFVKIFGYIITPNENYNLVTELKNIKDSKKVDGALVFNDVVKCVIELKGTNTTDLGKVETQAFSYKTNQSNCEYVITSNFEKLRFYIGDAIDFVEFNLFELTQDEFYLMYLCLSSNSIENDLPLKLKSESISQEDLITKELYKDYSLFKRELYQNLIELNQGYDKLVLFKKSQKLLDRFLFLFFAEDKFLLPPNSVRLILDDWEDLIEKDEEIPLYNRFKKYFGYLNTGFKGKRYDVFPYNGGLFKSDDVLDNILIDDKLLFLHTKKLSEYDFESEVDVNILGHIFENSLNEIEEITNELISGEVDKTNTKRKKDGVFYTPKYITKYIVDNTVGKLCKEKKNELQINDEDYTTDKKRIKKTIKNLSDKLTDYRDWLLELTICDPACGSGAFLNQSLNFLISEHQYIDELQSKLFGDSIMLSDIENSILENNLFGVDINEESVEITKLSLWLRTAQPNRKLNSLSSNIKCGNSLIDEPIEGVENYFKWEQEFPKVFEKGGFDVVIGNPPYVISKKVEYYENQYLTFKCNDLYAYFYEKSLKILKPEGLMGLITPSSFLTNIGFISLRELLVKYHIEYIIDLESNVFSDASVDSTIVIINNKFSKNQTIKCSGPNFDFREISKELFRRLDNIIFNIYINPNSLLLSDKISEENKILDDYINFSRGIEFGFKSEKVSKTKESEDFKPLLCGGNIGKYQINFQNSYVKHDINNHSIYK
ncbi:BREX-1 system adenine-specific DNA-methyltransferase PglX, partial [Flavobacteriaceae bacterium]|nr:BREX-1 system adenine-specific DNA-methyltransferase PglX [Flavobacteriaceae bacterium]